MNFYAGLALLAGGYTALMVIAIKAGWVDRAIDGAQRRKRKPMPALVRRIPGKPVDGSPLSHEEWEMLAALYVGLPEHLQNARWQL